MISTILFDMDGTLIDSEALAFQAILDCAKEWKVSITREDASFVAGKKWEVAFDLIFGKYRLPVSKTEASQAILEHYRELLKTKLVVVPGCVEAVEDFAKNGFKLALVSGSHRREILWTLEKLGILQHFPVILGAEDYPNSKPAPDGYLKALQMLGSKPEEALVFEDSFPGIASGKAAGCKVCAVFSTNHFKQDLSAADIEIRDFQGVNSTWIKSKF